jgi:hypothetical protein
VTQEQLFLVMIVAAGMLTLGYFRGWKANLTLVRAISGELEAVLKPKDQTYTWLGGVLGFTGEYTGNSQAPRVEATLTLSPRHSLLYLPIARLVTGGDRLYMVAYPARPVSSEAHVIADSYRRRLGRLPGEENWRRETVEINSHRFEILGEDPSIVASLRDWVRSLPQASHVKHLALVPSTGNLYLYLVPVPGEVQPIVGRTLAWFASRS